MNGESSALAVEPNMQLYLQPCLVCGRTFLPEALSRHAKICAKLSTKPRRVFDSSKQRTVVGAAPPARVPDRLSSSSHSHTWKEKHQQLIKTIRNARRAASETQPSPTAIPSDYKQCPGCERYFSPRVAENHIAWCRSKLARIPPSPQPGSSEAMERLKARTQYRPPAPSSLTRRNSRSAALSRPPRQPAHRMVHSSPAELETTPHSSRSQHYKKPSSSSVQQVSPLPPPRKIPAPPPVKFKERFPNHGTTPPLPISSNSNNKDYDPYRQADLQMKSLIESTSPSGPKTVPGKRVPPGLNWPANNKTDNEINLLQLRISDLNTEDSYLAAGDASSRLAKKDANNNRSYHHQPNGCMLPAVAAATTTTRQSGRLPQFCHQCGTRYPVLAAKFCCECGYRRQGIS